MNNNTSDYYDNMKFTRRECICCESSNSRKSISERGKNVANCLEFRELAAHNVRSLKQILRKSGINLMPRYGYRQSVISQALLGHCLALRMRNGKKYYVRKKVRMVQKSSQNPCLGWYNSSRLVNSFHLANIYVNKKKL